MCARVSPSLSQTEVTVRRGTYIRYHYSQLLIELSFRGNYFISWIMIIIIITYHYFLHKRINANRINGQSVLLYHHHSTYQHTDDVSILDVEWFLANVRPGSMNPFLPLTIVVVVNGHWILGHTASRKFTHTHGMLE